jgi:sulfur carrier protein
MVSLLSPFLKFKNFKGMEIIINDQKKTFNSGLTVQQLLDMEIPEKQKGIAVAINNCVVPKSDWSLRSIQPNDSILIIKATQGG